VEQQLSTLLDIMRSVLQPEDGPDRKIPPPKQLARKLKKDAGVTTRSLDLGCGLQPRNAFDADDVYGIDIRENIDEKIFKADLAVEPIPFEADFFDYVTAFDFIEHIPRTVYTTTRKFCFVDLMSEIYRVLKPGGIFFSSTPAFPKCAAFQDPTHVNIITKETFPLYFDDRNNWAAIYGFKGAFEILDQKWRYGTHLEAMMRKVAR
jgi:SAM-dependent methyltransferase